MYRNKLKKAIMIICKAKRCSGFVFYFIKSTFLSILFLRKEVKSSAKQTLLFEPLYPMCWFTSMSHFRRMSYRIKTKCIQTKKCGTKKSFRS